VDAHERSYSPVMDIRRDLTYMGDQMVEDLGVMWLDSLLGVHPHATFVRIYTASEFDRKGSR